MYSLKTLQGIFILIDNKILIFFFTAISDLTQKLLLALFQDFLELTVIMEEGPNKLILWKNI